MAKRNFAICQFYKQKFAHHLSLSKIKVGDSTNFYNHAFNSRAAVFDKPI